MKRLFVMPYLAALFGIFVYAIMQMSSAEDIKPWLMVLLATGPMLIFMLGVAVKQKGRTRANLIPEVSLAIIATAGAAYLQHTEAMMLSLGFGVVGIALYDFWYSNLGRDTTKLTEGSQLPEFELKDTEGTVISSRAVDKPAVWMFIRGNWCPLCVAQVKEMAKEYRELQEKGIEVFVIAAQSHEQTKRLSEKFDAPMKFMVDEGNKAVATLGLIHEGGMPVGMPGYENDTFYPTILITDEKQNILYSDQTQNYRVRPEPADFLQVFNQT